MMVHLCILTSLQHISGWEKDCVTAVFNEELLSQLTTTLSGVDSWLILPNRTRAVHGNSTRGFAAQNFSIRPPDRDQPPPLDAERRRRRRRRSQQTRSLHGLWRRSLAPPSGPQRHTARDLSALGGCDSGRLDAHRSGPAQTLPTELDQRTFTKNSAELNTHEI